MDETKKAWEEVGESFSKFGRMVADRYNKSKTTEPLGDGMADALRRATDELDRAFTSLGDTFRDDDAKEHLRATGKKLNDALKTTFADVSEKIRQANESRKQQSVG